MRLTKTIRFEASHRLPHYSGKCGRLHGHSWILDVEFDGPVDIYTGMVIDYGDIKRNVQPLVDSLDHRHLGTWELPLQPHRYDVAGYNVWGLAGWLPIDFNATSENLLAVIARRLTSTTPEFLWSALTLHETCTCQATLTRKEFEERYGQEEDGEETSEEAEEGDVGHPI